MYENQWGLLAMTLKTVKAIVTQEFIDRRDELALSPTWLEGHPSYGNKEHARKRADFEFAEWHQALYVDPTNMTLTEGDDRFDYDVFCKITGENDFKYDSIGGVVLEDRCERNIKEGKVKVIRPWKWIKGHRPFGPPLKVGQKVEYVVTGIVNAKEALKHLKFDGKSSNRFPHPLPEKKQKKFDLDEALEGIRGARMDDNYYYFQKK